MGLKAESIVAPLLAWYGRHARDLPWRKRGGLQDPYRVWLSEIMLQQTTVPAVAPYYAKFLAHYPDVHALAAAPVEDVMRDWAGLGYYSRARNLHACAKTVANDLGGAFPRTIAGLKALPGIGDYTAGAIAAIAFGQKASVVDGNVDRVITRLYAITTPLPASKPDIRAKAQALYMDDANTAPADLPQAFMDLGATVCTPANPKCAICPVSAPCMARAQGIQASLPARAPKAARPKRQGYVYWITDARGRVLVHRRPDKGLLGGMAGLPTTEWAEGEPAHLPGFEIDGVEGSHVKHVFTHFELTLRIARARVAALPAGYAFAVPGEAGLPSVFQKVVKMMG